MIGQNIDATTATAVWFFKIEIPAVRACQEYLKQNGELSAEPAVMLYDEDGTLRHTQLVFGMDNVYKRSVSQYLHSSV